MKPFVPGRAREDRATIVAAAASVGARAAAPP